MSSWKKYKLGDIIEVIGGGTPKTSIAEYWDGDIPWLSVADFNTGNKYVSSAEKKITELGLKKSSTKYLDKDDIIISARGTVGVVAMLAKPMTFNQSCYGIKAIQNESINNYVYYLLKYTVRHFQQVSYGAVFDTITKNTFYEVDIFLPPLDEQKAIANILSSFDKKIELLKEQNQTLETMAGAIFKEWFVDFNYPNATGEMIDSEMGEIPKGWRVGILEEVTNIKGGATPSTSNTEFWDGDICWSSPKDLSSHDFAFLLDTNKKITQKGLEKISSGLLPKGTLLLSSRAPIGYLAISNVDIAINQGYIALLDNAIFSNYFMYLWLKRNMDLVINSANGSTFLEISKGSFKKIKCVIPTTNILNDFNIVIKSVFNKLLLNTKQIHTLEETRDSLLPKLMSGEVRVEI